MPKITDMDNQEELREITNIKDLPTEINIEDLPPEINSLIASFLSLEDKKSLRLASTQLKNAISTYHDFDRAKSISSPQELDDFIATFKSRIEAQETQEVIGKDSDSPEHPSPEYPFKEIKLILNHGLIKSIKKDHFKFLSSAAKEVCVAIDLSEKRDFKTLEDSCKRIKSQISQLDNVKIKELNLRHWKLTSQNAAKIISVLADEIESLDLPTYFIFPLSSEGFYCPNLRFQSCLYTN